MFCLKYLPVLVLLIHNISSDELKCGPEIEPKCKCYTASSATSQVVCTGTITAEELVTIGGKITGDGYLLHISKATLIEIKATTFSAATFKKIFIEDNEALTKIDATAFKLSARTETLAIRNNKLLQKSGLFEVAKKVGDSLIDVEFQENLIDSFDDAFNADVFKNLAYIRLDGQKGNTEITLKANSFANLPKLTQLSLNDNKLKYVSGVIIDLTKTLTQHVSIFLQSTQLTIVDGLVSPIKIGVGLDLEKNKLTSVPKVCQEIAAVATGVCYLSGYDTSLLKCTCTDAETIKVTKILKAEATKNNIQGLTELACTDGPKISACAETNGGF